VVRLNNPKGRELSNGIEDFIDEYGYEPENRLIIYFSGRGKARIDGAATIGVGDWRIDHQCKPA